MDATKPARRTPRPAATAFLASAACLLALGIAAEEAAEKKTLPMEVSETIEVVEIQLEVQVTGKEGDPVDDLDASDFEVRVGGEPAEVLAVDRIAGRAGRGGKASRRAVDREAGADRGLTMVVFVDQLHTTPVTSWPILGEVWEFIENDLEKGDRVMVATYDGAVSVPLPLTDDMGEVKEALANVGRMQAGRLNVDEEQRTMQQIQEMQEMNMQGARTQPCVNLEPLAIGYATAAHSETLSTIAALERFIDTLAGLPGRKAVVHVSDGLPLIPGRGPYEYIIELCGGFEAAARGVDNAFDHGIDVYDHTDINKMRLDMMRYDTSEQWYQLAARANRNNVTFFPIQALGLRDPTFGGAGNQVRGASAVVDLGRGANLQDSLVLLAGETGGEAIVNRNRVGPALDRIAGELRDYYLLSVRGVGGAVGDVHKIAVDVDRPGVEVRHRRSMRLQSRHEQVADRVLTAVVHATSDNPMGLSARVGSTTPAGDGLRNVRVKLEIPLAALTLLPTAPDRPTQGLFTVFVAAKDEQGRATPVRTATVPVQVEPGDEADSSYVYEVEMEMRAGEHTVGFGVFDEIGGGASYLRTVVEG